MNWHVYSLLMVVLCLSACDIICPVIENDFATIQNLTGRSLSLYLCKGSVGEAQATLPSDGDAHDISLGDREANEVRGGMGANCKGVTGGPFRMEIALSAQSFGQVRLCRQTQNLLGQNLIVDNSQNCPQGFTEAGAVSPSPGSNCPSL